MFQGALCIESVMESWNNKSVGLCLSQLSIAREKENLLQDLGRDPKNRLHEVSQASWLSFENGFV